MLFHLARMLHKTVAELEATITVREMIEWGCFLALEAEDAQIEQQQTKQDKLLGQILTFDAKLANMKSLTREQVKELE